MSDNPEHEPDGNAPKGRAPDDPDSNDHGADLADAADFAAFDLDELPAPSLAEAPEPDFSQMLGDAADSTDEGDEWANFTGETYMQATTEEYHGLARDVARTAAEPVEQSAIAADIPGLESAVVSLEDVGDGEPVAPIAVTNATDLGLRLLTGIGLIVLLGASLISPLAIGILAFVVLVLAAGEFYAVLVKQRFRPVTIVGLLATAACLAGAWVWGVEAVPIALSVLLVVVGLMFGLAQPRPTLRIDAPLTVLVAAWVGGLGAFVYPMVAADDYRWLISGTVIAVVAMDVGQYFVGRRFGKRPLAPVVSPKKTVEGLLGGAVTALLVMAVFAFFAPPFTLGIALALAAAAIVLGPLGDLSVSLVKRVLKIKDMGTVLPGHGGILDRIDALLFVLPAAWLVFRFTNVLG